MKKDGWDGIESEDKIQWTFSGALFYSIIVITTIGEFEIIFIIVFLYSLQNKTKNDIHNTY